LATQVEGKNREERKRQEKSFTFVLKSRKAKREKEKRAREGLKIKHTETEGTFVVGKRRHNGILTFSNEFMVNWKSFYGLVFMFP
jgi:hypothetical protein